MVVTLCNLVNIQELAAENVTLLLFFLFFILFLFYLFLQTITDNYTELNIR